MWARLGDLMVNIWIKRNFDINFMESVLIKLRDLQLHVLIHVHVIPRTPLRIGGLNWRASSYSSWQTPQQ